MSNKKNIVSLNRKARHNYTIEETYEAGLVLQGTEVKSLRDGKASIAEGYADQIHNELFLLNVHIPEYLEANRFNHNPKRARKLLLHRREINKLIGKVKLKGYTLVPLAIYFNEKNRAKVELGLAKGQAKLDKRATIKEREWNREKQRVIKHSLQSN